MHLTWTQILTGRAVCSDHPFQAPDWQSNPKATESTTCSLRVRLNDIVTLRAQRNNPFAFRLFSYAKYLPSGAQLESIACCLCLRLRQAPQPATAENGNQFERCSNYSFPHSWCQTPGTRRPNACMPLLYSKATYTVHSLCQLKVMFDCNNISNSRTYLLNINIKVIELRWNAETFTTSSRRATEQ